MLTLKEFLLDIGKAEHYRIYLPNRDCLLFESYYTTHSPYKLTKTQIFKLNDKYYTENNFCDNVRSLKIDRETKNLLKIFGGCKITSIECSSFCPSKIYLTPKGKSKLKFYTNIGYQPCFNIFIIME